MAIGESTLGPTVTGVLSLDDVSLEGKTVLPVSYTHLTLPTNREV